MRTTQAARYARWSAAIAILLVLAVAAVYAQRAWLSHQVQQEAIPVPASVQEQSAQFTLSKVNGEKTQFTVRASRATEFTEGNRSLLEDVWITAYGTVTQRFDNLHTRSCEYVPTTGLITCAGDVQIDLQSSEDARLYAPSSGSEKPPSKVVHIATSQVSFERDTGVASTEQPVQFNLPQGDGSALGVRYDSQLGELRLLRDVKMTLRPTAAKGSGASAAIGTADVNITGSAMIYRRDDRIVRLLGPVEVQQGLSKLRAGNLNIELDEKLRARKIVATDHPEVAGIERGDPVTLAAENISVVLSPEGWTERVIAAGNVRLNNKNPTGENRLTAGQVELEPVAGTNRPRRMTATDDVTVQSALAEGGSRRMKTSSLIMDFVSRGDTGQSVVQHAATAAATLDWESPAQVPGKNTGKTGLQRMRLTSDQLDASFGGENELRELRGTGNVEMQRQLGDAAPVTSASRELVAQFAPGGEWSRVEQTGNVRLRDGNRTAQSERAQFDHAAGTATLTDAVVITDESSRTTPSRAPSRRQSMSFVPMAMS
jgi:lipopolysaccharide export system protein LptA